MVIVKHWDTWLEVVMAHGGMYYYWWNRNGDTMFTCELDGWMLEFF